MPSNKRRGPIPRRRRHDDEGEEDGSITGDIQEYASSEGSVNTDVEEDGDVSAPSIDDEAQSISSPMLGKQQPPQDVNHERRFKTTAETEAMLNGLRIRDGEVVEEVNFDDTAQAEDHPASSQTQHTSVPQSKPQSGSTAKVAGQNLPSSSRGQLSNDDRFRGHNDNGLANTRARGRGYPGPSTRGFVHVKPASLSC